MAKSRLMLRGAAYWRERLHLCLTRERERFTLPYHHHDFVEIHWVAEGSGYHYIGEDRLTVARGDLFIVPVGTPHVYRPASEAPKDELIVYNCLFEANLALELAAAYPEWPIAMEGLEGNERPYFRFRDTRGEAGALIERMHKEYQAKLPGYEAILHGQFIQLLVMLHRLKLRASGEAEAASPLADVYGYMEDNFGGRMALRKLAALVPVSVSHFQRLFKRETGQSVTGYVQSLRIRKSCELLAGTTLSVAAISRRVGYADTKFFTALFRRKTGVSPREYRRREAVAARPPRSPS